MRAAVCPSHGPRPAPRPWRAAAGSRAPPLPADAQVGSMPRARNSASASVNRRRGWSKSTALHALSLQAHLSSLPCAASSSRWVSRPRSSSAAARVKVTIKKRRNVRASLHQMQDALHQHRRLARTRRCAHQQVALSWQITLFCSGVNSGIPILPSAGKSTLSLSIFPLVLCALKPADAAVFSICTHPHWTCAWADLGVSLQSSPASSVSFRRVWRRRIENSSSVSVLFLLVSVTSPASASPALAAGRQRQQLLELFGVAAHLSTTALSQHKA